MIVRLIKLIVSLAVAALGYAVLNPAHWALVQAAPLSLQVPADWYALRLERLWIGSTIVLLGALCALACLAPKRR